MGCKGKGCGQCCGGWLPISKDELYEMFTLKEHVNKNVDEESCPFLSNNNTCNIYDSRPTICKIWDCGGEINSIHITKEYIEFICRQDIKPIDIGEIFLGRKTIQKMTRNKDEMISFV